VSKNVITDVNLPFKGYLRVFKRDKKTGEIVDYFENNNVLNYENIFRDYYFIIN